MAQTSGPFDPVDPLNPVPPGEVLAEADWEAMLRHIVDGIPDLPSSTQLRPAVSGSTARGVDLAAGLMLVAGHWYRNSGTVTLTSAANASGAARIDRAVARLDRTANTVTAVLVPGTPGAGQPPALTDNATVTDRPIARWTIGPAATAATGLVDERRFLADPILLCTSTTRPLGVRAGQLAYETDTGRWIFFNGSSWGVVYDDTGWVNLPIDWPTVWRLAGDPPVIRARRVGALVTVQIEVTRIGTALGVDDQDGAQICTVPAGMRTGYQYFAAQCTGAGTSGAITVRLQLKPDGSIWCTAPDRTVPVGRHLRQTITYMIN